MSDAPSKTCERCGAAFGCGATTGKCWCMDEGFKLPMPKPGESRYSDCLCPACLRVYAEEEKRARFA